MNTRWFFLASLFASLSAVGCGSSSDKSESAVTGSWRSTVEQNGIRSSAIWRFYDDGHVDQLVVEENGKGVRTSVCRANTSDSHWEDRGNKLLIRFGAASDEHLYEFLEGGSRLHLEPPVTLQNGSAPVNTYERDAAIDDNCADVQTPAAGTTH